MVGEANMTHGVNEDYFGGRVASLRMNAVSILWSDAAAHYTEVLSPARTRRHTVEGVFVSFCDGGQSVLPHGGR